MPETRNARFNRLHKEIWEDLSYILEVMERPAGDPDRVYLKRQVDKYLRPYSNGHLKRDLDKLRNFFAPGPSMANWSFTGSEPWKGIFLYFAFAHSPIGAEKGMTIRISPKAFCLTDTVLSGVMLHEATHFRLSTRDIAYDNSVWIGHEKLKELADGEHYQNADNWRIFYQKMRKYRRN